MMASKAFVSSLRLLLAFFSFAVALDSVSYDLNTYSKNDPSGTPYQTYMSNPTMKPPQVQINSNKSGLADGYIFLGINGQPSSGQNWPAIYDFSADRPGTLVWTANYTEPFDFRTQTYKGQPVLTFWSGELKNGYGRGSFYVLNQSYAEIAHFQVNRFGDNMGDLHEFEITPAGTALIVIYHAIPWDLTNMGGVKDGWLFENTVQEIDIETGRLVFEWNASSHMGVDESYNTLTDNVGRVQSSPWDYFHLNSIAKDQRGDYLVSGRHMHCVYKISGTDGHMIWRLQGKKSDFNVDSAAAFAFQHDARWLNNDQTRLTIFDNGPTDTVKYSRGLLLDVNQQDKTVKFIREFTNTAKTFAMYEGSVQAINSSDENTNFIMGYGSQPYFAELDHNGNVLLDVQFAKTNTVNSYRAFKEPWQGKPLTNPDVHWDKQGNKMYFSWNGATDVEMWEVCTASASNSGTWTTVASTKRTGFETTVDIADKQLDKFVRGKALDKTGGVLGWTNVMEGDSSTKPSAASGSLPSGKSAAVKDPSSDAVRRTEKVMAAVFVAAWTVMWM